MSFVLILTIGLLLSSAHFVSDLHSPSLFLIKASLIPITLITILLCGIYAIRKKQWITTVAVSLLIIANVPFILPLANKSQQYERKNTLSVATFSAMTRTRNTSDILAFLEKHQPDIVCLQELTKSDRISLIDSSGSEYPFFNQNENNQITLSKYPLTKIEDAGAYQINLLTHPNLGKVKLVNVHLPRPYNESGVPVVWQSLLSKLDDGSMAIMCGDFNITPNNSLYEVLTYQFNFDDSLTQGYGFTFPNSQRKIALLGAWFRIDFIFSRDLQALETITMNISEKSDHRAVLSYFDIEETNSQ